MAKHSDDENPETPVSEEAPAAAEALAETVAPAAPATHGNKGVIAAIAGGTAVIGLLLGLFIGWFAFDNSDGHGGRGDKDRMSHQYSPGKGGQQRGGQQGGKQGGRMMPDDDMMPGAGGGQMMPGSGGGQMMPGRGGQPGQQGSVPPAPNTAPTTPGTQATPQSLQQG